ncbi:unnamed protein product [Malus baccata var. baccata]
MDRMVAYETALRTWARWVDSSVDFNKTQVFFQGEWGDAKSENCRGQTQPLLGSQYPGGSYPAEFVPKKVLRSV